MYGFDAHSGLDHLCQDGRLAHIDHLFAVKGGVGVSGSADGGKQHIIGGFDRLVGQRGQGDYAKIGFAGDGHTVAHVIHFLRNFLKLR